MMRADLKNYEWTPAFWKGWRENGNRYRLHKSKRDRLLALEMLAPQDGERVLEVGCGYGWVSEVLWESAKIEWIGIDASPSMLAHLRQRAGGRSLINADACSIPLGDATFDRVLCSGVLMHVRDQWQALKELVRVLRPGGRLVFTIQNAYSPYNLPVRVHNLLKPGFIQTFTSPAKVGRVIRGLGLEPLATKGDGVVTTQPYCFGPFSLPPQTGSSLILWLDSRVVASFPWTAFEVWFSAQKPKA